MTALPLGMFRTVFPVVQAASIVAQVSGGSTFFNYLRMGVDGTEIEGKHILYAGDTVTNISVALKSVNWVHPDGRIVTTIYRWAKKNPYASATTVTPKVGIFTSEAFVLVDGDFVGKLPGLKYAPAHIQSISGVDYLVSYTLTSGGLGGMIVNKYKLLLDMDVSQTAVQTLAFDKNLSYSDTSSADDFYIDAQLENPYGDYGTTPLVEAYDYLPMHERQLVTNADGTKTVFSASRKRSGTWRGHPVFEITDTETTWAVTELGEFINVYGQSVGTPVYNRSVSGSLSEDVDLSAACINDYPSSGLDELIYSASGSVSGSVTASFEQVQTGTISKYYLGCAYDRATNEPVILQLHSGTRGVERTLSGSRSVSGANTWQYNMDADPGIPDVYGPSYGVSSTDTLTSSGNTPYSNFGSVTHNQYFKLLVSDVSDSTNSVIIDLTDSAANTTNFTTSVTASCDAPVYCVPEPFNGNHNAGIVWHVTKTHNASIKFREIANFNVISLANSAFVYHDVYLDTADSRVIDETWQYDGGLRWPIQQMPGGELIYKDYTAQQRIIVNVNDAETIVGTSDLLIEDYLFHAGGGLSIGSSESVSTTYDDACDSNYCDQDDVCMSYSSSISTTFS